MVNSESRQVTISTPSAAYCSQSAAIRSALLKRNFVSSNR